MSWTEERIGTLRTMWEGGQTASQIAEALGGVSRNAVIGKAHRLGLQSRPSPVVSKEEAKAAAERERVAQAAAAAAAAPPEPEPEPEAVVAAHAAEPRAVVPEPVVAVEEDEGAADGDRDGVRNGADDGVDDGDDDEVEDSEPVAPKPAPKPEMVMRSVGPGGFVRQSPGEQAPPSTPAPPRRLVPARTSAEFAHKTSLLDLSDKICKWPLGHPGEPDFHFCGDKVNPGFPYCVQHCGHAYQAQLPRRDRRAPPIPFGGPRAR